MARKSLPFRVVVNAPDHIDHKRIQACFDEFYIEQVAKALADSSLDKAGKLELLDRIIAYHTQDAYKST